MEPGKQAGRWKRLETEKQAGRWKRLETGAGGLPEAIEAGGYGPPPAIHVLP